MAREFIEVAAVTDVGNVRQYNEDSIAVDTENGIVALADGMGGHRAGEVASRMATDLLMAELAAATAETGPDADPQGTMLAVERSINRANLAIYTAGRVDAKQGGMGTTLALAVFRGGRVTWAHVGDSRVYRVRGARMQAADARRFAAARPGGTRRHFRGGGGPVAQPQPRHARARHRRVGGASSARTMRPCPATSTCCVPTASTTWSRTPTSSSSSVRCGPTCRWRPGTSCRRRRTTGDSTTSPSILARVREPEAAGRRGWFARLVAWLAARLD